MPEGETWHIELFQRFNKPSFKQLPELFDEQLSISLAAYRKFRHVFFHGYGFQLDWIRMQEGIENIENVYKRFKRNIYIFLNREALRSNK